MVSMKKYFLTPQKKSTTHANKTTSRRAIQRRTEGTTDLVGNKIAEKITKAAPKNYPEDIRKSMAAQIDETSVQPTETPMERYISSEGRQQIIDELRLLQENAVSEDHKFAKQNCSH